MNPAKRRPSKSTGVLGEREMIEIIQERLDPMPKMGVPFGDDVAAYDIGRGNLAILKTDMLVGKTDVPPGMTLWHAARKAVVMNISDFAAKGVKPLALLASLGLPKKTTRKDVEEIGDGLNAGAREFDTYVIGGDTGEAPGIIISLSAFGLAKQSNLMLRSGAQPGDIVAVTGLFGRPPAGLKILLHGFNASRRDRKTLVDSVLMPNARLKEGLALTAAKTITASIDSSDGLAWSFYEIANKSNVGFIIDKLPIAKESARFARTNKIDPVELALYGGEEYELVVTVKPKFWRTAAAAVSEVGGQLLRIGRVTREKCMLLQIKGKERPIEPKGYEHFRTNDA
jgi:thiamine-monophosphate kinase